MEGARVGSLSEQGELLRRCGEEPSRCGYLGRRGGLRGPRTHGGGLPWSQGAVTEAGLRPPDAVFFRELADLAGDPGLVGLGSVGTAAVKLQVAVDQLGMLAS